MIIISSSTKRWLLYQNSCNGFLFLPILSIWPHIKWLLSHPLHLHSICYPCCSHGGIKKAKGKLIHLILSTPCGRVVWHECFLIHCVWLTRNRGLLWMTLFPFAHCHQPPTHCDSYTKGWAWQLLFYSGTPFCQRVSRNIYPSTDCWLLWVFIKPRINHFRVGWHGTLIEIAFAFCHMTGFL